MEYVIKGRLIREGRGELRDLTDPKEQKDPKGFDFGRLCRGERVFFLFRGVCVCGKLVWVLWKDVRC